MLDTAAPPLPIVLPSVACAIGYFSLVLLILFQTRRSRTGMLLAVAAGLTASWATVTALTGNTSPLASMLDLLRMLAWLGFCLHLYRRPAASDVVPRIAVFATAIGLFAILTAAALTLGGVHLASPGDGVSLLSPAIALRLGLAIGQLLLLENLYRGTAPAQRHHLRLACIALGAVAAYDIAVCADAVLLLVASPTLVAGRPLVAVLITPLLAVAAARNRDWRIDIHVSRSAAFHTASLVASGVFLLALAAAGEAARHLGAFGVGWGSLAELCLLFAGMLTVVVLLTSGAARSTLRHFLTEHFFTHRFDYRREWQRCIDILSAESEGPLSARVVRALADALDSPSGLLFLREPGQAGLSWAGAWNTEPAASLPETNRLTPAIMAAERPLLLDPADLDSRSDTRSFTPWLAIPLREPAAQVKTVLGCIVLGQPRAPFRLDVEVFDLLQILSHEVAIHLAQQRAAAALLQTRDLRAYGERFAFVAHDIKNVSSQLSLLLANAETHLADPEFQNDMLATVRASVGRIGGMIRRLEPSSRAAAPPRLEPVALLTALVAERRHTGTAAATLEIEPSAAAAGAASIAMDEAAFHAAISHLVNNAATAAGPAGTVRIALRTLAMQVEIDIVDNGAGMTAEFVRDELFRPFATRTTGGSGLGAFQARELVRASGGELAVMSPPGGGTTMRVSLPRATPKLAHSSRGAPCVMAAEA